MSAAPAIDTTEEAPRFNPWTFMPLLYFMQAIPVTIVQEVASVIYKDLGVSNALITQWTSLIALPWSMQLLLGPLVDLNFTKRRWILGGQMLITFGLIATALLMRLPNPFGVTVAILGITAVTSALCNIATDGFYIMSMSRPQQAAFVGVQTTCYRLGRLFCMGLLVKIAGHYQEQGGDKMAVWGGVLIAVTVVYGIGTMVNTFFVPRPENDVPAPELEPNQNRKNLLRTLVVVAVGISGYFLLNALVRLTAHGLWSALDGQPEGKFKGWMLPNQASIVGFDLHLNGMMTEVVQAVICGLLLVAALTSAVRLLRGTEMANAFGTFLKLERIGWILFFILFYRLGEAMVSKMSPLFYKDKWDVGGLALDNSIVGDIKGFIGVIGIIVGGLLGGWVVSRFGLRKSFWPLAILMHLPNLFYLLASVQRDWALSGHSTVAFEMFFKYSFTIYPKLWMIEFVDQFGYGFGFAAYYVYLMQVAQRGNYKTSHYAIGSGLGALCIALAGILSGILQSNFGYTGFFTAVIFCTIPGMLALLFIPLDQQAPKPAV